MSKLFLEILEQKEENPKIVKLEVKDSKEANEKLLVEEPKFAGLKYVKIIHHCFHDEKTNKPCKITIL